MRIALIFLFVTLLSFGSDNLEVGTPSRNGQIIDREGYALCYSEEHEQPFWVSYKLTREEALSKKAERKDNFRPDPLIKTGSATLGDYKGSGYDRGHLAPAGDMKWSEKAMSESFYLSNMTPQKSGLNRGLWKELESHVRKWAIKRGAVFVITGAVIRPNYLTIGKNNVTIPQWFYKVIYDSDKKEVIAFAMPNRKPQKKLEEFVVSVDKIEELTGLNFLDKIDDELEEELEKTINLSAWSLRKREEQVVESYWLTNSSKKRHNSNCRLYKKTKGRTCNSEEGIPCGICGG